VHKLVYTRTSGPRYPPQLSNFERSELGGSWRRLSEKKNISCKLRVCHVRVTVDLPTFCLVTIFSVESKELELELEQPKKKSPSLYLSKNLENIYRKNSINMST